MSAQDVVQEQVNHKSEFGLHKRHSGNQQTHNRIANRCVPRTVALSQPILTMHTAPLFVAGNDSSVVDGSTKKGKHFP